MTTIEMNSQKHQLDIAMVLIHRKNMIMEINGIVSQLTQHSEWFKSIPARDSAIINAHLWKRVDELLSLMYKPYF